MWNFKTYGINFIFFLKLCDKITYAFVVVGTGNKIMWAVGGMGRGHQAESVLCVCVCGCLWGGGCAGWAWSGIKCCSGSKMFVTLIFNDHLHYCEIFLARFLISFVFTKRPQSFLIEYFRPSYRVWFSHINICVLTKQMRDKTTGKVIKWPVTKQRFAFPYKNSPVPHLSQ